MFLNLNTEIAPENFTLPKKKIIAWDSPLPKIIVLMFCIFIMYIRTPLLFLQPRFWAEEGLTYFSYAFDHSWYKALLTPHYSYYSLFDNIASMLAANIVPLQYAPFVTTYLAFSLQLIPFALILWGNSSLWDNMYKKIIVVLIVLFTPLSGEVYLNLLGSTFHFSLITFLILMEDVGNITTVRKWSYRILLVFAGLTGPVSCFLTPLFMYKAWSNRTREHIVQAGILSICALVQLLVVLMFVHQNALPITRFKGLDVSTLLSIIWVKTIVLPILGPKTAYTFFAEAAKRISRIGYHEVLLFVLLIVFFKSLISRVAPQKQMMILSSFILLTVISTFAADDPHKTSFIMASNPIPGGRYFYVPNILIKILLFSGIPYALMEIIISPHTPLNKTKELFGKVQPLLCSLLLILSLYTGIIYYKDAIMIKPFVNNTWPKWTEEVSKWEQDRNYKLRIWPKWCAGCFMELKGRPSD